MGKLDNNEEQTGAEMCTAHIKLWFGIVWLGLAGLGFCMAWFGMF